MTLDDVYPAQAVNLDLDILNNGLFEVRAELLQQKDLFAGTLALFHSVNQWLHLHLALQRQSVMMCQWHALVAPFLKMLFQVVIRC